MSADNPLSGFKELDEKLRALGSDLGGKALRQAVGAALTPTVKKVKAAAPQSDRAHRVYTKELVAPGFLSRNIKKRTKLDKTRTKASAFITASAKAFYGPQFVEKGTKFQAAQPWLEPTFQADQDKILERFKAQLKARIDKIAAKK